MNPYEGDISPELRAALKASGLYVWTGAAVFFSLLYLTGEFFKSLLIAVIVLISCLLGFGRRRLIQGGFAITFIAVVVSYGFPAPDQWLDLAKSASSTINYAWNHPANP